ncbi:succinyl-diaminopimelate desuccinylase [Aureimonas fodinaquatilis]|uniref:Succinyl-diaminopimelate desuccinylase n=1 Tax=Aureimonas fodinaquatilis TaxID=2565783 RepID=A0A5B0E1L8_9HYPH|nr:succinyl-diaminopimelate desuccinylase [Aureimonas fodinaquatilis]KAA0972723.1 succinyl-diaminopimelate desuccinylase [Aureimonas fodinaquatilis]
MYPTDPVANLAALIACPSVTPQEAGSLTVLEQQLATLSFEVERPIFSEDGTPDVENLLARYGSAGPHLAFAGHTDVVPPGDLQDWRHPPFAAVVENGRLFGRGAVDMKGGIACFVAAVARLHQRNALPQGQISLLITGDEEGPSVNGTEKLLAYALAQGQQYDACLVGEPTNPDALGDMMKIGRRGSLSGVLTLTGRLGHVAYPHLASNPLRAVAAVLQALQQEPLDNGTPDFQPSNLEVTGIDTGNPAVNVIPARVKLAFNIRFNDVWNVASLKGEVQRRVSEALASSSISGDIAQNLEWRERAGEVFLTRDESLVQSLAGAIEQVTGRHPQLSTSGGTSDARFIKNYCPVVEFGLVGQTMHMANEYVALSDLETLTAIYETFITGWFATHA